MVKSRESMSAEKYSTAFSALPPQFCRTVAVLVPFDRDERETPICG
jgi:hypothetical protein